jgi:hypothetical protein
MAKTHFWVSDLWRVDFVWWWPWVWCGFFCGGCCGFCVMVVGCSVGLCEILWLWVLMEKATNLNQNPLTIDLTKFQNPLTEQVRAQGWPWWPCSDLRSRAFAMEVMERGMREREKKKKGTEN